MATSDIIKQSVFDGRIEQFPAKYAVEKGALSVANAPYNAIGASQSQMTFNINVPSQNVFVDRLIQWSATTLMGCDVAVAGTQPAVGTHEPVLVFGRDIALRALPLNGLISTLTATINDTSVTVNLDTVLNEVLRLANFSKTRKIRTAPTMMDRYKSYDDAYLGVNSPLNSFLEAVEDAEVPNGAWYDIQFCDGNGVVLTGPATSYTYNSIVVNYIQMGARYIPIRTEFGTAEPTSYPIFFQWATTEPLVLSPFIFAEAHEYEVGLFGINNIQIVCNFKSAADVSRIIRTTTAAGRTVSNVRLVNYSSGQGGCFQNAKLNVQYLTPSLDLPLPAKSIVPYMEFPRYISTGFSAVAAYSETTLVSQTIVLPQIPDMLVIYAKPSTYATTDGDWYLAPRKISVQFDNFAGLLSSHTTQELYHMSTKCGLEMNYTQWAGEAFRAAASGANSVVPTTGGFLCLKPGESFALQSGQAPSLIGNFTLQFNYTVYNQSAASVTPVLYVIAINSGFFESLGGSSRIIKGVLSEADIISAEPAPAGIADRRMVGAGFFDRLGSWFSKAKDIYHATKPAVSAIKGHLPEGSVKSALSAVGYGRSGGAASGGARGKKSLEERLL